jgi:hypothetical protein
MNKTLPAYLPSPEASFITGASLNIDGALVLDLPE